MNLMCNRCARRGVHEDSGKNIFIESGTTWCVPHAAEYLDEIYSDMFRIPQVMSKDFR